MKEDLKHWDFLPFFRRETIFVTFCSFSAHKTLSKIGVYYKRKEFASKRSKFFPFKVHFFPEAQGGMAGQNSFDIDPFLKELELLPLESLSTILEYKFILYN